MEMRDKGVSGVGAQDMDTSGYQVSDLEVVEVFWEKEESVVDADFRPDLDTPFSPSTFNTFEIGSMAENPILIHEAQDTEKCPPFNHPTTLVSERPTQPPVLMRNRPFGKRIENVPDFAHRNLFE